MKHAYLTELEIHKSFRAGAITSKEATELIAKLKRCAERKKIDRRRQAAAQTQL